MSWIEVARKVMTEHQFQYVNAETGDMCTKTSEGAVALDAVTANMLVTVHDALSDENKAKFGTMPILKAVSIGWKLVK